MGVGIYRLQRQLLEQQKQEVNPITPKPKRKPGRPPKNTNKEVLKGE